MNTSCDAAVGITKSEQVRSFRYPAIVPLDLPPARDAHDMERELRVQRTHAAALEAAREEGVREGHARAVAETSERAEKQLAAIEAAIEEFSRDREQYFRRVEADVVKLAMAIARKILYREAQVDPLLLSAVVRIALEQLQGGSQVVLRTPPTTYDRWRRFAEGLAEKDLDLQVVEDAGCEEHAVRLETRSGRSEFSIEGSLQEIENGFLDLLRVETRECELA